MEEKILKLQIKTLDGHIEEIIISEEETIEDLKNQLENVIDYRYRSIEIKDSSELIEIDLQRIIIRKWKNN